MPQSIVPSTSSVISVSSESSDSDESDSEPDVVEELLGDEGRARIV